MRFGELLVIQGLVTPDDVDAALERQKREPGRIGSHLVEIGAITAGKLADVLPRLLRWQAMHDPSHPSEHRARYSYARALLAAGRRAEAIKHAEAALGGYRATVGEKHVWTHEVMRLIQEVQHTA
jgi:hypothetical protein